MLTLRLEIKKCKYMTVVSSKEFASNQKRYFDLAENEQVCIRQGGKMFHLTYSPAADDEKDDEYINIPNKRNKPDRKLSEMFRGVFSKEDAESFIEQIKTMREEWNT